MNDSLIKDIGRSYIVSSLLPASFFVLLAVFIFRNFLPFTEITTQSQTVVLSSGVMILALTMWIAFLLYSSVDFIFKLYEGYSYPPIIKIPLQYFQYALQRWRLRKYYSYKEQFDQIVSNITDESEKDNLLESLEELLYEAQIQVQKHELSAPLEAEWNQFLPTTFGNVLLASELYPYEKYNLDGATLFPRMSMVFPPEFVSAFEEKNNQVVFILNSSLLSYMVGILSLILGWLGRADLSSWDLFMRQLFQTYLGKGFYSTPANHYVFIGCFFLIIGYLIYRISINAVKEYALFIRTSFDLYRFKILRELNHPVPTSLKEEKLVWDSISEFLISGDRFGEKDFYYHLKPEFITPKKKENVMTRFLSLFSLWNKHSKSGS